MTNFNSNVADRSALLNAYMYLDKQSKLYSGKTLKDILDLLDKDKNFDTNNEYYKLLKKACTDNPELGNMTLVSQSHYDNTSDGKSIFNYSGDDCTDDPIQSCAFKDSNGNMYVVYRGTGDRRWGDNGQSFIDESTDMQEAAKKYFDLVVDKYGCDGELYVTGHSKGGNEAQYVTMASSYEYKITACYSFDGQGFSDNAIKEFRDNSNYESILKKMYSINGDNDPIHNLIGVIIPEENTYYVNTHYTNSSGKTNIGYFHDILGIISGAELDWQIDENGNITHGEEGWLSKLGKELNKNLQNLPADIKGSCAIALMSLIDSFKGGSMDDAVAGIGDYEKLIEIGIPVVLFSLSEFAISEIYDNYGFAGVIVTAIAAVGLTVILKPVLENVMELLSAVDIILHIADSVTELVKTVKRICQQAGKWADNILNTLSSCISKLKEWAYQNSSGYKYSTSNPNIEINTTAMRSYAAQLSSLSSRAKRLDSRMNSLYWQLGIEWDSIANLGKLLKAEAVLDYAYRLDKCVNYLNQTASDFDEAERVLINKF